MLDLSLTVSRLDDVVADPRAWSSALDEVAGIMGARGAMLMTTDQAVEMPFSSDLTGALSIYVSEGWIPHDPRRRALPKVLLGQAAIEETIMTAEEHRTLPFFRDLSSRVDLPWWGVVGFHDGVDRFALSVLRSAKQGPLGREDLENLQRFSGRLSEVATLSRAASRAQLASVGEVLGQLGIAAVAIDRFGFVLEWNALADATFADGLRVAGRRLVIADPGAAEAYASALARLRWLPEGAAIGGDPFVVMRARSPVLAKLVSVSRRARMPFGGARALVILSPLTSPGAGPDARLLRQAFGLTASQARLASLLATGRSLRQVADLSGTSINTARAHLRTIFDKTGTRRQSELVALLASLA